MKKKVTFVNDCSNVSHTIAKYLDRENFDVDFLMRTRGLWSKTFGIIWRISRARGDIFHCAYALQDAYLVSKLKHLDVLHCHGSDVRWTIHGGWGWMVKSSLKKAEIVLYSTPDLEADVKPYREDAAYLPNPIELDVFYPRLELRTHEGLRAVYFVKPYEGVPSEIIGHLEGRGVKVDVIRGSPIDYGEMPKFLNSYDILIDRFAIPSLSKTCLEAMSCGLCTIDYRHKQNFREQVENLGDDEYRRGEGLANRQYIESNHDAKRVAETMTKIYQNL
jgi:hypothetical protein